MAQVTNFFVGANSGEGFRNLFSEMVDIEDTYDFMVLKGTERRPRRREKYVYAGDWPDNGGGGNSGRVPVVFRRPGFPGWCGAPGAPLRHSGRYVAPRECVKRTVDKHNSIFG